MRSVSDRSGWSRRLAFVLGLLLVLGGCAATERPPGAGTPASPSVPDTAGADDVIQGTGTIRYVDLEGGFYGLVADDGTTYDPTPLPDSLCKDGRRVRFRVRETNALTTRMWGTTVEVLHIEITNN
jgi:hypothetical protein